MLTAHPPPVMPDRSLLSHAIFILANTPNFRRVLQNCRQHVHCTSHLQGFKPIWDAVDRVAAQRIGGELVNERSPARKDKMSQTAGKMLRNSNHQASVSFTVPQVLTVMAHFALGPGATGIESFRFCELLDTLLRKLLLDDARAKDLMQDFVGRRYYAACNGTEIELEGADADDYWWTYLPLPLGYDGSQGTWNLYDAMDRHLEDIRRKLSDRRFAVGFTNVPEILRIQVVGRHVGQKMFKHQPKLHIGSCFSINQYCTPHMLGKGRELQLEARRALTVHIKEQQKLYSGAVDIQVSVGYGHSLLTTPYASARLWFGHRCSSHRIFSNVTEPIPLFVSIIRVPDARWTRFWKEQPDC